MVCFHSTEKKIGVFLQNVTLVDRNIYCQYLTYHNYSHLSIFFREYSLLNDFVAQSNLADWAKWSAIYYILLMDVI